eukprot:scaffold44106_cov60-Attheya_sp.AAC.1
MQHRGASIARQGSGADASNSNAVMEQPQERALVLNCHWQETGSGFHLCGIQYKTYTGTKNRVRKKAIINNGTKRKWFSLPHHPPAALIISTLPVWTVETSKWGLMDNKTIGRRRKADGKACGHYFSCF